MPNLPNFTKELDALAPTQQGKANLLGVTPKTIRRWLKGDIPDGMYNIARVPQLLEALIRDTTEASSVPTTQHSIEG